MSGPPSRTCICVPDVRLAVRRDPQVVRVVAVRTGGGGRPALDLLLPRVRGLLVRRRHSPRHRSCVAMSAAHTSPAISARDGRRRVAAWRSPSAPAGSAGRARRRSRPTSSRAPSPRYRFGRAGGQARSGTRPRPSAGRRRPASRRAASSAGTSRRPAAGAATGSPGHGSLRPCLRSPAGRSRSGTGHATRPRGRRRGPEASSPRPTGDRERRRTHLGRSCPRWPPAPWPTRSTPW